MNRNEKFEWKKQVVRDMTKQGAKVTDMAKRLGMGEEEMYAFLSRNFGGVRKLRESMGLPRDVKRRDFAFAAETLKEPKLVKVEAKDRKRFNTEDKPSKAFNDTTETLTGFLEGQKQRVMAELKDDLRIEIQKTLEELKSELIEDFKQDLVTEISSIYS